MKILRNIRAGGRVGNGYLLAIAVSRLVWDHL